MRNAHKILIAKPEEGRRPLGGDQGVRIILEFALNLDVRRRLYLNG